MDHFEHRGEAALERRVLELQTRFDRLQLLVRVLAVAVLALTALVLLPMILDVLKVLLMLAGAIFIVRSVADGAWGRLFAPVRVLSRMVRAAF